MPRDWRRPWLDATPQEEALARLLAAPRDPDEEMLYPYEVPRPRWAMHLSRAAELLTMLPPTPREKRALKIVRGMGR